MDAGIADYLSRMESTVLAARDSMVKLTEENKALRLRIAELEQALHGKRDAEPKTAAKAKQAVVRAVKATKVAPRAPASTSATASVHTGRRPMEPLSSVAAGGPGPQEESSVEAARAMSSQIDEEMMQWSMGSSESESGEGSGESDGEEEGDKESGTLDVLVVAAEEQTEEECDEDHDGHGETSSSDDAPERTIDSDSDLEAGVTAAYTPNGVLPGSVTTDGVTSGKIASKLSALLLEHSGQNRNNIFANLFATHSVPKMGIEIYSWLRACVREQWPGCSASSFCTLPDPVTARIDIILSLFNFLCYFGSSKGGTSVLPTANNLYTAEQLLIRIIDQTFAVCRLLRISQHDGLAFYTASAGSAPIGDPTHATDGTGAQEDPVGLRSEGEDTKPCDRDIDVAMTSNKCISATLQLIFKIVLSMGPRRSTYLLGFVEESIRLVASTCSWGLIVGLLVSLNQIPTDVWPSLGLEESGLVTSLVLIVDAITATEIPTAMHGCVRELIELLEAGRRVHVSISKYEPALIGCIHSSESGNFSAASDQLTALLHLIYDDDHPRARRRSSVSEGFSRWTTGCVRAPEALVQVASKSPYAHLDSMLHVIWSRAGLWPTLAIMGRCSLQGGKSILARIGLDFVEEFSASILSLLREVSAFKAVVSEYQDRQMPDLDGTFNKLNEKFDLLYCLCRNKGPMDELLLSRAINLDGVCRQYFSDHWRSELNNPAVAGQGAVDYAYNWKMFSSCVQAVLSEYDPGECGWRVGKLGRAEHADARMTSVANALRSTLTSLYVSCTEAREDSGDELLKLFKEHPLIGSSMSQNVAKSTLQVLTSTFSNLSAIYNGNSTVVGFAALGADDSPRHAIWKHVKHIVALLSMMACEQFLYLASLTASAFIRELTANINASTATEDHVIAGMECLRFLLSQPQPWGLGAKCADVRIAAEFCKVVVKYRRIFPGTNANEVWYRFGTRSYHDISIWIQQLSVKLPAILINLARRPDRRRRVEKMCSESGLLVARFPAVDAQRIKATGKPMNSSDNPETLKIPSTLIAETWDSSLNSTFDETCMANPAVTMSPSERACAVSHLIVWQSIVDITKNAMKSKREDWAHCSQLRDFIEQHDAISGDDNYYEWTKILRFSMSPDEPATEKELSCPREISERPHFFLVLEDDALIREKGSTASFIAHIRYIMERLPRDCDMCYLGYAANWKKQSEESARESDDKSLFFIPSYLWQLHGYLLSCDGARKLLSHAPVDAPVDNYVGRLVYEKKLKCLALKEKLITQSNFKSIAYGVGSTKTGDSDIHHSATMGPSMRGKRPKYGVSGHVGKRRV